MNIKLNENPFIILLVSVALLIATSLINWSDITNDGESDVIKNYNLLSELIPTQSDSITTEVASTEFIDPALIEAMKEDSIKKNVIDSTKLPTAEITTEVPVIQAPTDTTRTIIVDTAVIELKSPKVNGEVQIEDYTVSQHGLANFKRAIANRNSKVVRIAVIGDSYIEGDIFTQHIRELLQNRFGGQGVGYVAMDCITKKFRKSVKHNSSGWKTYSLNKKGGNNFYALSGLYCTSTKNTSASYSGTSFINNVNSWNSSKFLFIAPENTIIEVNAGNGWEKHDVIGGNDVKCISVAANTNKFEVKTEANSLIGLGVWLTGNNGISVDCMSLRGNSGITHTKVNSALAHEMSKYIDYDLIILEYGLNVLSASNTKYDFYANNIVKVVNHLRKCYPNADFLILGSGDRGVKTGSEIHSIKTAPYLVEAQREAARRSQCLFWDTREAMGGEDAVVTWCANGEINKDYIHLSTKGGKRLANIFVKSLLKAVNE